MLFLWLMQQKCKNESMVMNERINLEVFLFQIWDMGWMRPGQGSGLSGEIWKGGFETENGGCVINGGIQGEERLNI